MFPHFPREVQQSSKACQVPAFSVSCCLISLPSPLYTHSVSHAELASFLAMPGSQSSPSLPTCGLLGWSTFPEHQPLLPSLHEANSMYSLGLQQHPHLLQKPSLTANLGEGSPVLSQVPPPLQAARCTCLGDGQLTAGSEEAGWFCL